MVDWNEIVELVEEALYVSLEIEDLTDMLVNRLGFSVEKAEEIMDNIIKQVMDAEDQYKLDLAIDICGYIQDCVHIRDKKLYPEDAPGQLHLFE